MLKDPESQFLERWEDFQWFSPTFWVVKLNKKRKTHYILAFHCLFWPFWKKRWKKSAFLDFFITGEIHFAKNTLFGPKKCSIFLATRKTSSKIHWKAKNIRKKNVADFANILKIVNFRKSSKLRNLRIFKCP